MIRFATRIGVGAFALWCTATAFLYVKQDSMIFAPPPVQALPESYRQFQSLQLITPDGETLNLLEHPADPGQSWVIVFHGNGGDATRMLPEADKLAEAGFGVLIAEYRGYNASTGTPSQSGLYIDALTAFDHLATSTSGKIHLYAHSLGTAMAVHVAQNREVESVALLSPFDSVLSVASARYPILPIKPFLKHPFPLDEKIGSVTEPIIIFHGDRDTVVPIKHGEALYAAAPLGTLFRTIKDAGHNDLHGRGATEEAAQFFLKMESR